MAWEITSKCNLKCVHCRSSSGIHSTVGRFTLEKSKEFIDNLVDFANPVIVLTGGEPLMREDIFDIAKYGTDKGLRMAMATNGSLVTDEVCEKMLASGIRICSLSLDALSRRYMMIFVSRRGHFRLSWMLLHFSESMVLNSLSILHSRS